MVQILQHDAKMNRSQFKITFFEIGPAGVFLTCQKFFLKAKILIEVSKQLQNVTKWKPRIWSWVQV